MQVSGFPIPVQLMELIDAGRWPRNAEEAHAQNVTLRVPIERIHRIAPDECWIYFDPPPFVLGGGSLAASFDWSGMADGVEVPGDIDLKYAIIIGDFGLGSDAPIALDYRKNLVNPSVIRYKWAKTGNRWVEIAPSFQLFAQLLEL